VAYPHCIQYSTSFECPHKSDPADADVEELLGADGADDVPPDAVVSGVGTLGAQADAAQGQCHFIVHHHQMAGCAQNLAIRYAAASPERFIKVRSFTSATGVLLW